MLESLELAPPDKILSLMALYRDDPRAQKIDLGVGVYKDVAGATPVLGAVREAERRLWESQSTKTYLGMTGDETFNRQMIELVLGPDAPLTRARAAQTPGGSGALRVIGELLNLARPGATVWLPDPSWANHEHILRRSGLKLARYPYIEGTGVAFDKMTLALKGAKAGDIVLLHGCCHNPTGVDLSLAQWDALADLIVAGGLFPFVDLAYQGFGDGLDEDAAGLRKFVAKAPEVAAAVSCSKNFSVYRDRVGAAMIIARDVREADAALSQMAGVARTLYSMPPDHGAAVVSIILGDPALRARWRGELDAMRGRMQAMRRELADALRLATNSPRFDFLVGQKGMFSRLGLDVEQVARLRSEGGVYMVDDSRINIAGLNSEKIEGLARKIAAVI